jgi:hypothetical protein
MLEISFLLQIQNTGACEQGPVSSAGRFLRVPYDLPDARAERFWFMSRASCSDFRTFGETFVTRRRNLINEVADLSRTLCGKERNARKRRFLRADGALDSYVQKRRLMSCPMLWRRRQTTRSRSWEWQQALAIAKPSKPCTESMATMGGVGGRCAGCIGHFAGVAAVLRGGTQIPREVSKG